jgi:hypothetical protein
MRYYFSMETSKLLAEIDAEIARLQQARALLNGKEVKRQPGRPAKKTTAKKRTMSAEGRARIAAAQKARWANAKKAAK